MVQFFIKGAVTDFVLAWQLLTAVPLPFKPENHERPAGWAATYYPVVGLVLGGLLAAASWLFYSLFPAGIASALVLVMWVGLTGMLHLDGFMDACDGLLPPRAPARRLEIMKDSRVGAFGVVGGVLLLLLKFNGLNALSADYRLPVLIVVPMLARWTVTWAMARYSPARTDGMGAFFLKGLTGTRVGIASLVTIGIAIWLMGIAGGVLVVVAWITAILVARFAVARIGGLTGDIYGTICETVETVLLVAATAAGWEIILFPLLP